MDKKEASFILANIDRRVCDDELNEALDMAIKALEQEPKTDTWSIKDVANTFKKHGLIVEQEPCEDALIEDCCRTCLYCRYIKTPEVTGNPVDYVCQNKGSVVSDIDIKNCDEMYSPKTPKVKVEVK